MINQFSKLAHLEMAQGGLKKGKSGKSTTTRKTAPKIKKNKGKGKSISLKAKRLLTKSINRNIENTLAERAFDSGTRMKLVKRPKKQDIKDRRSEILSSTLTKLSG